MPSCILRWQWTTYTPTALYQASVLAAAAAAATDDQAWWCGWWWWWQLTRSRLIVTCNSYFSAVFQLQNTYHCQDFEILRKQQISAVRRPKFTILWGHVGEVSVFNKFFPIVDTCLSCEDTARQSCAMMPKWRFFASCIFSEPRAAHFRHTF